MVFVSILAVLLLDPSPIQQNKTNYQRVVERPDPNNGYEDYVRATDMVRGGELGVLLSWSPRQYDDMLEMKRAVLAGRGGGKETAEEAEWTGDDEARLIRAKQLQSLGYLGVQRLMVDEYGGALALVRLGNEKRVWDPREKMTLDTVFPELAGFKTIAKLYRADAYVRFADGDTKGGTNDLLEGLTFSRRIGGSNLITELVSNASQSIVLAAFEEQLPHLSQRDAAQIIKYAEAARQEPNSYLRAIQFERDFAVGNIDQILADPGSWVTLARDDDSHADGLGQFIKGMSPRDRQTLKESLAKTVGDSYDRVLAKLGAEEGTWASITGGEVPASPTSFTTVQDAVDELARWVMPSLNQATVAALKSRAQLRLLGLHARVIDFRWKNNRLPRDLKEVAPEAILFDPLGNEAFHYELTGDGYKLYSKGLATTGPIELRYRRPANLPAQKDDPIPPR